MCLVWANWKYRKARLDLDVSLETVRAEQKGRPGLDADPPGMRDQRPRGESLAWIWRRVPSLDLEEGAQPGSGRGSPAPYFGHLMGRVDSLEKTLMLGGIGGQEEKGTTEDEMAGWHH